MKPSVRLWSFRIATALAAPALLLLLAEAGLRVVGYGHRSDFTVPCTVQGRPAFCENDRFTWQFFPPRLFRLPYSFAIPAQKPPGTFRIFVVGESAAQGVPEPSYGFARYLEVMLRDRFPSMRFEVVNTGISSINSHVLLPVTRDLARRHPDLFVLYIGNNEVVGPYGPETTLTPRASSLFLIRTGIALKSTRVGQLLGGIFQAAKASAPAEWRGIQMFLQHQVPADDPALARVYQNFQRNLSDIVRVARSSGAPVLISTVGANLKDCAPFGSQHRKDLPARDLERWQALVGEGASLEDRARPQSALERYQAAASIDDRYAELQFRIGRVYWALGDFAAARDRFSRSRDLDVLRFRADSRLNQIIRSVAAAAGPGVELLDGEAMLSDASPHGVPGRELFYEHVHLNPAGNYLMARALFRNVVARLPGDLRPPTASAEPPPAAEADRLLALTPFDRRRVAQQVGEWLSQPPFTYQLGNDQQVKEVQRQAAVSDDSAESESGYRWAIARAPRDRWLRFNYGVFLESREPDRSAAEFAAALQILPGDYRTREKLVDELLRLRRFEEAIAQCRELLRRMPYHAPAYLTIGYALTQLDSLDESISAYHRAIHLDPAFAVDGYNQIGIVELHQGRLAAAAVSFQRAIDLDKGHTRMAELQRNLSYAQAELANLR